MSHLSPVCPLFRPLSPHVSPHNAKISIDNLGTKFSWTDTASKQIFCCIQKVSMHFFPSPKSFNSLKISKLIWYQKLKPLWYTPLSKILTCMWYDIIMSKYSSLISQFLRVRKFYFYPSIFPHLSIQHSFGFEGFFLILESCPTHSTGSGTGELK